MKTIEQLKKRGYVSEFKSKDISDNDLEVINEIILEASDKYGEGLRIENLDGEFVYNNLLDYEYKYGKIVKAPRYISFTTTDVKKGYEKTGFVGERIISKLIENGIDAKWLEINDHDEEVFKIFNFEEGAYLVNFIAIGYGIKESNISKLLKNKYKNSIKNLTNMGYSDTMDMKTDSEIIYKLSIHEFVYNDEFGHMFNDNKLENTGLQRIFQSLHLAPTITNRQLWRVLMHEEKLFIVFISDDKIAKIEAGILRFYLGEALVSNGIKTRWYEVDDLDLKRYKFPEESFVPGYFTY